MLGFAWPRGFAAALVMADRSGRTAPDTEEGTMPSRSSKLAVPLLLAVAIAHAGCADAPTAAPEANAPILKKGGGGSKPGGDDTGLAVTLTGTLGGTEQTVSGRNDARTLAIKGDYTLTLDVNLDSLVCGDLPGRIPDEPGLVAFVQQSTSAVGALDIAYDKTAPDPGRVDSWTTTIDGLDYKVQFFRWASSDLTEGADGTVVQYRGGSIEVFKKQGGKYVSREQCFGEFVDYDLTVR
jgi:hypothetical protein